MENIENNTTDDLQSDIQFVSTKSERLKLKWPIKDWSERSSPAKTRMYQFMEENTVNMVQWRLEVSPCDKDVQGQDVVSVALYLTYSGTNISRDYKVIVTLSILDAHGVESHSHSSCVYYLTREGPPDGANPSYKVNICSREELMTHHLSYLPDNTLIVIARLVFVQEQSSDVCDHVYVDNFLDGSNSLSSDLSDAFKSTDFTDMTIVCDKREFHCHKFMLAARSEVFAAMLRHEFLEKQSSRVDVKEIDAETMELLLNYIYTGRVTDFKSVSVVELFKVSIKYYINPLGFVKIQFSFS